MNEQLKITLLKRKFQSIPYFEEFISNYKKFNQTGINAFDAYQQYRQEHPEFQPSNTLLMEEDFWEYRAIPNFYGNLGAADEALENAEKGKFRQSALWQETSAASVVVLMAFERILWMSPLQKCVRNIVTYLMLLTSKPAI